MNRPARAIALLLPLLAAAGGCAEDEASPPPYESGVDDNVQLGNLTPDQKTTICNSKASYVRARVDTTALTRFWCAFTPAVLLAPSDADCEAAMGSCVQAFSVKLDIVVTDPNAPAPECTVTADTSQCKGTIGEYETCVEQLADVQLRIGTDFSCGKRADYSSSPTVGVNACEALGPTCTVASAPPEVR